MIKLFLVLAVTSICATLYYPHDNNQKNQNIALEKIKSLAAQEINHLKSMDYSIIQIKDMLHKEASTLNPKIIDHVATVLLRAEQYNIEHTNILSVIDYSLTADAKRLWIFDLDNKKLLFHTYVSHGIKSGALVTNNFSNKYNSKCTSIGVYKTEQPYYGRDGFSLRLKGLDYGFNDNASNRSIVMHGSWYVDEAFIKKYGRTGRSWGCPAVPIELAKPIINTIKDGSLLIAYYPSDEWLHKSKFLKNTNTEVVKQQEKLTPLIDPTDQREDVLFAHVSKHYNSEENEAIIIMPAEQYAILFNTKPPLKRMIRRQIEKREYIALSDGELQQILNNPTNQDSLHAMYFAIPTIKMLKTEMKILNFGPIKAIKANSTTDKNNTYTVYFENKPALSLRSTDRFVRWLGL